MAEGLCSGFFVRLASFLWPMSYSRRMMIPDITIRTSRMSSYFSIVERTYDGPELPTAVNVRQKRTRLGPGGDLRLASP
jgi:hypothetical protein